MSSRSGLRFVQARQAVLAAGAALLATAALVAPHAAHAGDVYWSVGVSQPGVSVGVSNAPPAPVVVGQAPVIVQQAPVVVQPAPVYRAPVVVQPQPVYAAPVYPAYPVYAPRPVVRVGWVPPGHRWGHHEWREGYREGRWEGRWEGRMEGRGYDRR